MLAFSRFKQVERTTWVWLCPQCFQAQRSGVSGSKAACANPRRKSSTNTSTSSNLTGFTVVIYLSLLVLFFAYCYPISRLTQYLERRYAFY